MKIKEIKLRIREQWLLFRALCLLKLDALRLDFACYMADALQRAKNKRFYVVRNAHDRLIWVCNEDIRQMQKARRVRRLIGGRLREFKVRLMKKGTGHLDVMRTCLYYTPLDRNNSNGITVEERNRRKAGWLKYMEEIRMRRMLGKLR